MAFSVSQDIEPINLDNNNNNISIATNIRNRSLDRALTNTDKS